MQQFVHITGSVPLRDGAVAIDLVNHTVYELAREFLRQNIGLVALVGASRNDAVVAFDTIIVRAAADYAREAGINGVSLRTVRHRDKWLANTDRETRQHLVQLGDGVSDETLSDEEYIGGNIRSVQADNSDGVVVVGGSRGVNDTATLMLDDSMPVEEIIVMGVSGGLSEKNRGRIEECRGYRSGLDQRTVSGFDDCSNVIAWVVSDLKKRLKTSCEGCKRSGVSSQSATNPSGKRWTSRLWDRATSSKVASWASAVVGAVRLFIAFGKTEV